MPLLLEGTWIDEEARVLNVNAQSIAWALIEFEWVSLGYVGWRTLYLHPNYPAGVGYMLQIATAACVSGRTVRLQVSNDTDPEGLSAILAIQFWNAAVKQ